MKTLSFTDKQLVKIENKEQFDEMCDSLKGLRVRPFEVWERETYGTYPEFPVYLEKTKSPFSDKVICTGVTYGPIDGYEILSFEEATKEI